jgi:hypothetical protein
LRVNCDSFRSDEASLAIDDLYGRDPWFGGYPYYIVARFPCNIDVARAISRDRPRLRPEGEARVTVSKDPLGTKRKPECVVRANWCPYNSSRMSIIPLLRDVEDAARQRETIGPDEIDWLPVAAHDQRIGATDQGTALFVDVAYTTSGIRDFDDLCGRSSD